MTRRRSRAQIAATWVACCFALAACSETVLIREISADQPGRPVAEVSQQPGQTGPSAQANPSSGPLAPGSNPTYGPGSLPTSGPEAAVRCATGGRETGVSANQIKWGTILPLSGPTRPLGEQTARVMQRSVAYFNGVFTDASVPGLNWSCPGSRGIYGREVKLEIAAISSDSEDDVLAAMRRLVDVEKVLLVRDCYLQASLMGPAHNYAERNGVITSWCFPESLRQPQLMTHTWAPGMSSEDQAALLTGHLVKTLGKKRIALLYDPTYQETAKIVRTVAEKLGAVITTEVQARAQTAVNGRRSEVLELRSSNPDAVLVLDALNGTYAGVAAGQLQWRPKDSGVAWACNKCWLKFQADVCGENCEGMLTTTAIVPFKPYNTAAQSLYDIKRRIFPNEPDDILTFAAILITGQLFVDIATTGPDLTRARLERVMATKVNFSGSGVPPLTTSAFDHFGSQSDWIIKFSGRPWPNGFTDVTGGYVGLRQVGVDPSWSRQ